VGNLSWSVTDTDLQDVSAPLRRHRLAPKVAACPGHVPPSACPLPPAPALTWYRIVMRSQFMQAAGTVKSAQVVRYPDGRSKVRAIILPPRLPGCPHKPHPTHTPTPHGCDGALTLGCARREFWRGQGWGLVEFADPAGASQAISNLSDLDLMGRKVFIREDREREGGEGGGGAAAAQGGNSRSRSGRGRSRARPPLENPAEEPTSGTALFIGNLPWSTTSSQLREVFSEYNVKTAEVRTPRLARGLHAAHATAPRATSRRRGGAPFLTRRLCAHACSEHGRSRRGTTAARVATAWSHSSRRRTRRRPLRSPGTTSTGARCSSALTGSSGRTSDRGAVDERAPRIGVAAQEPWRRHRAG
jgi:hypothetical protein